MWIKDNQQYSTNEAIRQACPNISFPAYLTAEMVADAGFLTVTQLPQPDFDSATQRITNGAVTEVGGQWQQGWLVTDITADEIAAMQQASNKGVQESTISATQNRLDTFAKTRNYDGILSACTYATSAVPSFKSDADYCIAQRDGTWAALYQFMADVQSGTKPFPTGFADVESLLPALSWPA